MFNPPYNALSALPCRLILLGTETIKVHGLQAELQRWELFHHSSVQFITSPNAWIEAAHECKWEE